MSFKHLNVPDGWEQYWTKYPQGYTVMEALINWVSQVDSMVDNVNEWNTYLDAFVNEFDKELQTTVTTILSEWQDSGFLDVVISEALQWQLDDYIATNEQDKLSLTTDLEQRAVNVKTLGAKGDGVTDDTLFFQQALDTKKNVFIPQGNYIITDTLNYYTRQKISGVGDTSLIVSEIVGKPIMTNAEPHFNTHHEKFKIQGNGQELNGIEMLNGFEHMYINFVSIVGVGGNGLHLVNTYGLYTNGLHIIGDEKTVNGIYANGSNGCNISEALIKSCDNGIRLDWTYKFDIKNSLVEANYGNGIYMQRANVTSIKDVYFEGNGINKESGLYYDIFLDDDPEGRITNHFVIQDCYARSNYVESTVRINTRLNGGKIDGFYISGNDHQEYEFDIDLKNSGSIKTANINTSKLNDNGQSQFIHISNDIIPLRRQKTIKLHYLDSAIGTTIAGDIPCSIISGYVQNGGLTYLNFEIKNINMADIPLNSLVVISLPINRSTYSGYFTSPLHFIGSHTDIRGLISVIDNRPYISIQKIGTETHASTRFDTRYFPSITQIKGSIMYY